MKYFKNSATYLVLIYAVTLGLTVLLNFNYPSKAAYFVNFFLPTNIDVSQQPFIRYRIILWIVSSIILLIIMPIIGYFEIPETNVEKMQNFPWWKIVLMIILSPLIWIGYPIIALCTTCATSNDVLYFILTVLFFFGLQLFAHAIVFKTKFLLRWK